VDTDKLYSLLGTLAVHLLILLILGFTVLRTIVPEEEEGILVNFGNVNTSTGMFEPSYTGGASLPVPPQPQPAVNQEDFLTQDLEESVAIEEARKREEQRIENERRIAEETERRREEEQRRRENAISSRVAGAFGSGNAQGNNQGDASTGAGNQGSPFGNSDRGANEGTGGEGPLFTLDGRRPAGMGGLPRPEYSVQEEGRIVINITVDPKGAVIFAEIGRGTTIDNASMRQSALNAARKAKFNSIPGTNNQSGTITYNYRLTQ
jgi:TonB family protein